jgi:hypothetical protein
MQRAKRLTRDAHDRDTFSRERASAISVAAVLRHVHQQRAGPQRGVTVARDEVDDRQPFDMRQQPQPHFLDRQQLNVGESLLSQSSNQIVTVLSR